MVAFFGFCLLVILQLWIASTATATTTTSSSSSNEACIDGGTSILLSFGLYKNTCPPAELVVFSWVQKAVMEDPRMAASLLRLHFHDCFVNGCDASVLLDDDAPNFIGEKTANPNLNSLRGFEVIDAIKNDLESICPGTVSCADILTIAARDSVVLSGGPGWEVQLGRKDSRTASKTAANNNIPGPNSDVATLVAKFQNVGLTSDDMVALSGAHTLGKARCSTFSSRLNRNGNGSPDVNLEFIQSLQQLCNTNTTLANLDLVTPSTFDNQYYVNLLSGEGLLASDQALVVSGDEQVLQTVRSFAENPMIFLEEFKKSMVRMGQLLPSSTGGGGEEEEESEVRRNCRAKN